MSSYKTQGLLLGTLINIVMPVSTMQVATLAGVSWKTARDNLENLFKLGFIMRRRVGNNKRIYWKNA